MTNSLYNQVNQSFRPRWVFPCRSAAGKGADFFWSSWFTPILSDRAIFLEELMEGTIRDD